MTEYILIPVIIILLLVIQGFFSNSEMAVVSSNKIRLKYMQKKGDKRAIIVFDFLNNHEKLFGTTLVGINIATVVSTSISDHYFVNVLSRDSTVVSELVRMGLLPILIMHPLILIFGEIFPMSMARKFPTITALRNSYILKTAYFILYPLMILVSTISKLFKKLFRSNKEGFGAITRDELQLIFDGKFDNASDVTRKLVEDVFNLNNLTAYDIMVHLNDVLAVDENITVAELKKIILSSAYNRFPVYRDSIFNIVSTVHSISILGIDDEESIKSCTEKLYIVPSTKKASDVLKELKKNRKYMAIVVDEFGAACGIITIENIAEEIIGKVGEEQIPFKEKQIAKEGEDIILDGLTYLDDLFDMTGINLTDEDAETISGIINIALGRIGRKGEVVNFKDKITFEILDSSDRFVKTVKVKRIEDYEE